MIDEHRWTWMIEINFKACLISFSSPFGLLFVFRDIKMHSWSTLDSTYQSSSCSLHDFSLLVFECLVGIHPRGMHWKSFRQLYETYINHSFFKILAPDYTFKQENADLNGFNNNHITSSHMSIIGMQWMCLFQQVWLRCFCCVSGWYICRLAWMRDCPTSQVQCTSLLLNV